jgi:Glycosyltransferase family 87
LTSVGALHAGGDGRWAFLTRPGPWFWILVALGLVARVLLATATAGTPDVRLWRNHAHQVAQNGLIAHYAFDRSFVHPPPIAWAMSRLERLSRRVGVAFESLYRLIIALVDFASAFLILCVLRGSRWRYLACAAYCVTPVALILGAQHGNTDALVAAGLLAATLLASRRRPVATGALIGLVACVKIPGLLAAPALGFALPRWRDRIVCALVALAIAAAPYAWLIAQAGRLAERHAGIELGSRRVALEHVLMYHGYVMKMKGEPSVWLWGPKNFVALVYGANSQRWPRWAWWWLHHSHAVALPLVLLFAFLRRRAKSAPAIATTIAGSYAIIYALVETWATQYLAWSTPFWMLAGWPFAVASNVFAGAYIYGYYAFRGQDWLLRPRWVRDLTSADWPAYLTVLRDLAVLVFLAFAVYWLARALFDELRAWHPARPVDQPEP